MEDTFKIYKYTFAPNDGVVRMPALAKLLHVGQQDNHDITVWAAVDTRRRDVNRCLRVAGTGWALPLGEYVGTVQMPSGLVWHVFDQGEEIE